MRAFLRQLRPAAVALGLATAACGVAYPLAVTAVARLGWASAAEGHLIERDGVVVGADVIGQPFSSAWYFHSRPSAAGGSPTASGGSNLGPSNPRLLAAVAARVAAYRAENGLGDDVLVPVDAVTASASGLDPHISVRNAMLQVERVAAARGADPAAVRRLVTERTVHRPLGFLGDSGVNVLRLNLALDEAWPVDP